MPVNVGWKGKMYLNIGTYDAPELQELRNVKGVKIPNSMNKDDTSTRADLGVDTEVVTTQKLGASWQMVDKGSGDADLTAIRTAFYARTPIELFLLDGVATATASRGVRALVQVQKFDLDQDNAKAGVYDVEVGPTPSSDGNPPVSPISGSAGWTISE